MLPLGFEPTISAGERPQTYTVYRAAIGTGGLGMWQGNIIKDPKEIRLECVNLIYLTEDRDNCELF